MGRARAACMGFEPGHPRGAGSVHDGVERANQGQHHASGSHVIERWYVVFSSSFRYDGAPCISHETVDKIHTLCGRKVDDAATLESDNNNLEPDCNICRRASKRLRKPLTRDPSDEAQLKCEACIRDHAPGVLRKPCGANGCECWCNRSVAAPVDNTTGQPSGPDRGLG